jgi:hypothetical protein
VTNHQLDQRIIAKQAEQIAELKRQLAEAAQGTRETLGLFLSERDENIRLERQLSEAKADTADLDWYDANPKAIVYASGYRGDRDSWSYRGRDGFKLDAGTLREAIRAARKETA